MFVAVHELSHPLIFQRLFQQMFESADTEVEAKQRTAKQI